MSRRELTACAALMRHAWLSRVNQSSNSLTWLLLVLALVVPLVGGAVTGRWAASIGYGAGVPLAFLALFWWTLLVASVAGQNRHAGRLVPRIGVRSVKVLVTCWTAVVLALTLLFGLAGETPAMVAGMAGLTLVAVAAILAAPNAVLPLWLFWLATRFLGERQKAQFAWLFANDTALMAAPVLIVGLGCIVLRNIVKGLPQAGGTAGLLFRPDGVRLVVPAPPSYARRLRRDCVKARPAALLMHALGPAVRAPALKFFAVALGVALLTGFVAPGWLAVYRPLLRMALPAAVVALQVLIAPSMLQAVYAARAEQALVRLAPRVPRADALTASLWRSLLLEYGNWWGRLTLLALLLAAALDAKLSALLNIFSACLLMLAPAAMLLRDYSVARGRIAPVRWGMILALLGCWILTLFASGGFLGVRPWLALSAIILAGVTLLVRLRWTRMPRAI